MRAQALWLSTALLYPAGALAATPTPAELICSGANKGSGTACPGGKPAGSDAALIGDITQIANLLLYVAGAAAVLVIIIGGIRYVTSTGDAGRVKGAKDTVLYGVIGLVVAMLAFAIVNFVIARLG